MTSQSFKVEDRLPFFVETNVDCLLRTVSIFRADCIDNRRIAKDCLIEICRSWELFTIVLDEADKLELGSRKGDTALFLTEQV